MAGVSILEVIQALFLYPGLALVLALGVAFGWLTEGRVAPVDLRGTAWLSLDALASLVSLMLSALALVLLPWPLHLAAGWSWIGSPAALWVALEGAFLVPLLPGLLAPSSLGGRAASREGQMSTAGRCVLWLAVGVALWGGVSWALLALPGRVLLALAGLLALPAAIGVGPFSAERSLNTAGAEEGLDEATAALVRFARTARGATLLSVFLIGSLPRTAGTWPPLIATGPAAQIQPWIALLIFAALFVILALLSRRLIGALPRLPLPAALRWCWWRALPLGLVGIVYLVIVGMS